MIDSVTKKREDQAPFMLFLHFVPHLFLQPFLAKLTESFNRYVWCEWNIRSPLIKYVVYYAQEKHVHNLSGTSGNDTFKLVTEEDSHKQMSLFLL